MLIKDVAVLVVDDVNAMRAQIKEMLRSFGFQTVTVAPNGEAAKEALETGLYQLILADWHMTPTDGLELLKYVRNHPMYKQVCYVMVTAEGTKEKVVEALKCGVDDYLLKPLTPVQIQNKVYGVLLKKKVLS